MDAEREALAVPWAGIPATASMPAVAAGLRGAAGSPGATFGKK